MTFVRILLFALLVPVCAFAQVQLPEFSISNIPTVELEQDMNIDYERVFSSINNPMMRDIMRLQYQINLLERLIKRQTEIQRIAQSYESIGVPFKQPAPPETACAQLPVNVLCMAFYPDSSKYKNLIGERVDEFQRDQRRQMDIMMQEMMNEPASYVAAPANNDTAGAPMVRPQQRQSTPNEQYVWTDIRCLAGQCSALLIDGGDSNLRFRIRDGEELPEGGKIKSISVSGVKVSYEGKTYDLNPEAVSGGRRVDPRPDTSNIANILNRNLGDTANVSPAVQAVNDAAIEPQTIDNGDAAPPLLGPTGLF